MADIGIHHKICSKFHQDHGQMAENRTVQIRHSNFATKAVKYSLHKSLVAYFSTCEEGRYNLHTIVTAMGHVDRGHYMNLWVMCHCLLPFADASQMTLKAQIIRQVRRPGLPQKSRRPSTRQVRGLLENLVLIRF